MPESLGEQVKLRRHQLGWTQERLAEKADVDTTTVQRIEWGKNAPEADTVRKLAQALGVSISELRFGFTEERLSVLREQLMCPTCGAVLVARHSSAPWDDGEELDIFECGRTSGRTNRPCPTDPSFPKWEEYTLEFFQEQDDGHLCIASGRTNAARSVDLASGIGATHEEAERLVRRSYIMARDGYDAAEAEYPLFGAQ